MSSGGSTLHTGEVEFHDQQVNVIFDYGNERLYLKPNRHFDTPFESESAAAPVNR